ncbi:MAG: hypothetical protein DRO98_04275 [Archaeoglobales archaeon]|nr:MAG: hypothetical protein DRO98_04275 [Archaeoglobales archaeon]
MLNLVILSLMKSTENFLWITRGVKKRMERVVNEFRAIYEKYSTKNEDYCLVFVGIAGITELLLNALEQIMDEEREWGIVLPDAAGKHFILSQAEQVARLLEELEDYPLPECVSEKACVSEAWGRCQKIWEKLSHHFHTIEHIADV